MVQIEYAMVLSEYPWSVLTVQSNSVAASQGGYLLYNRPLVHRCEHTPYPQVHRIPAYCLSMAPRSPNRPKTPGICPDALASISAFTTALPLCWFRRSSRRLAQRVRTVRSSPSSCCSRLPPCCSCARAASASVLRFKSTNHLTSHSFTIKSREGYSKKVSTLPSSHYQSDFLTT